MFPPKQSAAEPLALIIDDDATIRLLARHTLELAGMRVAEAEDGEQGLAEFARLAPDIVLLDVLMPVKSGFEVCVALRSTR